MGMSTSTTELLRGSVVLVLTQLPGQSH